MENDIVDRLRVLGMTLYEAKVYLGLLQHGPQNGNELAKAAELPSSKVYATLEKLASLGIVHTIRRGSTTRYACIAPDELVKRFRARFTEPLDYLEQTLPGLAAVVTTGEVLSISGIEAIVENSRSIIDHARNEIFLSIWPEDLTELAEAIVAADRRGVKVFGMIYGGGSGPDAGSWLEHSYGEIVSGRIAGRMLTLSADTEEALIAHIPRRGRATAVRTRSPVIVLIAQEYLHHDIVLQRAQLNIGFDQWDEWWQADPDLRTLIFHNSLAASEADPGAEPVKSTRRRGTTR